MIIQTLLLIVTGFISAFIDSIAGGGGIISLPSFLALGVPSYFALGTNKFASTASSFTSSLHYAQSDKVDFKLLKFLVPFTLIGAALGANIVLSIDQHLLSIMVLILVLGVGIYSFFSKQVGQSNCFRDLTKRNIVFGILLAFGLGFYDGFFGPGTGSFLMFGLIFIYGFDFVQASGNARVLNFASNIAALITFALHHQVNYMIGFPVMIAMIFGARMGTKMALNKGVKVVKPVFIAMSLIVAGRMLISLLK